MTELWKIPRDWSGETCAILGGGPSMSQAVADLVRNRCRVIAVNNQGISGVNGSGRRFPALAPWADVLYAADRLWWYNNRDEAAKFAGLRVTVMPNGYHDFTAVVRDTLILGNGGPSGIDDRPDHVRTGQNSGYQAVQVAMHFGAKRILLCGFDMHGKDGQHWHGDHRWRRGYVSRHELFLAAFAEAAPEYASRGVEVLCCTKGSALLEHYTYVDLWEALGYGVQHVRKGEARPAGEGAKGAGGTRALAARG